MNFTNIHNPIQVADGIALTMTTESGDVIEFKATPNDVMEYGRDLYNRAILGEFGTPVVKNDYYNEVEAGIKNLIRQALISSDITLLRCMESGIALPVEWVNYRVALRSLLSSTLDESTVIPVRPPYPV